MLRFLLDLITLLKLLELAESIHGGMNDFTR